MSWILKPLLCTTDIHYIFLFICVHMHVGIHMCTMTHVWQSEDNLEALVPPAVCTPGDQSQNTGLGCRGFYWVSHLTSFDIFFSMILIQFCAYHYFEKNKPQVPLVLFLPIPLSHVKNHHYLLYGLLDFQDPFYSARERRTELQKASRFPAISTPPPQETQRKWQGPRCIWKPRVWPTEPCLRP